SSSSSSALPDGGWGSFIAGRSASSPSSTAGRPLRVTGPARRSVEGSGRWILVRMDQPTVALYERNAPEWSRRRGTATDGLGRLFRERVGTGLVADLGCGSGRYLPELGAPVAGRDVTAASRHLPRAH